MSQNFNKQPPSHDASMMDIARKAVEKPVIVTNPAEIESIKRNGFGDIIGGYKEGGALDGYWFADRDSLNEWRDRQKAHEFGLVDGAES